MSTSPARPWCASGGGHMSWRTFVVGVDASAEAAAAAGFACRTAERADAGCRLVHATRDVLAAFEAPPAGGGPPPRPGHPRRGPSAPPLGRGVGGVPPRA